MFRRPLAEPSLIYFLFLVLGLVWVPGCSALQTVPDLGNLYNKLAQQEDPSRNPVIVIPGILGSRLEEGNTREVVWGGFGSEAVDPTTAEGASLLALPMPKALRYRICGIR